MKFRTGSGLLTELIWDAAKINREDHEGTQWNTICLLRPTVFMHWINCTDPATLADGAGGDKVLRLHRTVSSRMAHSQGRGQALCVCHTLLPMSGQCLEHVREQSTRGRIWDEKRLTYNTSMNLFIKNIQLLSWLHLWGQRLHGNAFFPISLRLNRGSTCWGCHHFYTLKPFEANLIFLGNRNKYFRLDGFQESAYNSLKKTNLKFKIIR